MGARGPRIQGYHCLVPDLTGFGKSSQQGPFEMDRAADAVAELIRSRVSTSRAHVVGLSLGAQVGVQLAGDGAQTRRPRGAVRDRRQHDAGSGADAAPAVPLARTTWFRRAIIAAGTRAMRGFQRPGSMTSVRT